MALENDTKSEEKLTCGMENDMRNLANLDQSTQNSQNWDSYGVFFIQSRKFTSLKFIKELCVMTMKIVATFLRGIDLSFQKWHEEFDEFGPEHSKVLKTCTLNGSF